MDEEYTSRYYDSEKLSLILVATSPFIGKFVYPLGGYRHFSPLHVSLY